MEFHVFKRNFMTCAQSKEVETVDYKLHGQTLERVNSTGYLRVTIQKDGQWAEHIHNISQKGKRLLGFLRRNLKIGSQTIKEQA